MPSRRTGTKAVRRAPRVCDVTLASRSTIQPIHKSVSTMQRGEATMKVAVKTLSIFLQDVFAYIPPGLLPCVGPLSSKAESISKIFVTSSSVRSS